MITLLCECLTGCARSVDSKRNRSTLNTVVIVAIFELIGVVSYSGWLVGHAVSKHWRVILVNHVEQRGCPLLNDFFLIWEIFNWHRPERKHLRWERIRFLSRKRICFCGAGLKEVHTASGSRRHHISPRWSWCVQSSPSINLLDKDARRRMRWVPLILVHDWSDNLLAASWLLRKVIEVDMCDGSILGEWVICVGAQRKLETWILF